MKRIFFLLIVCFSIIKAQEKNYQLSGLLSIDSKISFDFSKQLDLSNEFDNSVKINEENSNKKLQKKSPFLASVLSFAVPGAGQFYSKSFLKSVVFIAIEATAITVGLIYNKKGDDQTNFFQNFANQHWDVKRYARWTIVNINKLNPTVELSNFKVFDDNGNVNWSELNKLESEIGGYYSHRLAPYGDQQYYEMIGKYPQFNVGWDDFGDENTPFAYGDPLTKNFIYYSHERGKANDFYNIAYKAVLVIITNHIISAIDAAWTTSRYNKNLQISAKLEKYELGYRTLYYPQLNLQYTF